MKSRSELSPIPTSAHGNGQRLDVASILESLSDTMIEAAPAVRQLEKQASKFRQQQLRSLQRIEAVTSRCENHLLQLAGRMSSVEVTLENTPSEAVKSKEFVLPLEQRLEALEHNTEQVRRLADAIAEKQQQLADDFIERRVTDHLFKEFMNIQFALDRYSANGTTDLKADIRATAEAIEAFLGESGLRILNPSPGAAFEPREHQPVKVVQVLDLQADGTIAETFTPGLCRPHRVIQQARVAVFKANRMKTTSH